MNIPDEGFFTLLTQGMRNRTVETLQRALYHTLRDAILQGTLTARCRLPGSRVMAERLHLSRNTVNAALEQLALEGYLTRSRQGTQVAPLASCRQERVRCRPSCCLSGCKGCQPRCAATHRRWHLRQAYRR